MYERCPSYGVTTPIWFGKTPDLKNLVTIFSTFEASVLSWASVDAIHGEEVGGITDSGMMSRWTRFLLAQGFDRRTWACQVLAMGSRCFSASVLAP